LAVFETGADFEVVGSMAEGQFLSLLSYSICLVLVSERALLGSFAS
jgi:hypothetical protein